MIFFFFLFKIFLFFNNVQKTKSNHLFMIIFVFCCCCRCCCCCCRCCCCCSCPCACCCCSFLKMSQHNSHLFREKDKHEYVCEEDYSMSHTCWWDILDLRTFVLVVFRPWIDRRCLTVTSTYRCCSFTNQSHQLWLGWALTSNHDWRKRMKANWIVLF